MTLIPIGKFARASRLSVKSLRNYDESGLLSAAHVDPQSGYRYYRLEQVARADAIRSLRMVDMPLGQIAQILDGEDPELVLMAHLESLQKQRDELNQMAQQLQRRINLKEFIMSTETTVRNNPAVVVAAHRTDTTHTEIFEHIPAGFGTVMASLAQHNIDPAGAPFTLYYQAPDADAPGDIAMCIPVSDSHNVETLDPTVELLKLEAGQTACVVHRGSYANMGESYATVAGWVHEHGHDIVGPTREIYLNSPAEVSEDELLTEIHFPIDTDGAA